MARHVPDSQFRELARYNAQPLHQSNGSDAGNDESNETDKIARVVDLNEYAGGIKMYQMINQDSIAVNSAGPRPATKVTKAIPGTKMI